MREPSSAGFDGSSVVASPSPPPQHLLERLKDYGQEDAFALWDDLSPEERDLLVKDIEVNFTPCAILFFRSGILIHLSSLIVVRSGNEIPVDLEFCSW